MSSMQLMQLTLHVYIYRVKALTQLNATHVTFGSAHISQDVLVLRNGIINIDRFPMKNC